MTPLPAEIYEPAEVEALAQAAGRSRIGKRNRALVLLLARAGLRVAEALALEPRDVSTTSGNIRVRRGKGHKARTIPLDTITEDAILAWATVRPPDAQTLICTLKETPLKAAYVRELLPRLARKAGITKRVHPHGLRHYFAVQLDRDGESLATIRDLLGHSSAATTAIYLGRLRGVDQRTAARLRQRGWAS